tara:strand:+ start:979 stop:1380 length:402 start_codon:yes stop_codon:yes gene_type:complete
MPIIKTEILGTLIDINYEEGEKDKLIKIIDNFNKRLLVFNNLKGKISDKKIIYLAGLKAEDQILDNDIKNKNSDLVDHINKEIINLKDNIRELEIEKKRLSDLNLKAINEIEKIEKEINILTKKIILENNDKD